MQDENIKLINGCAYELIKDIKDKSIDLIVTDPPYLIDMKTKGYGVMRGKNILSQLQDIKNGFDFSIFKEYERVLKEINIYIYCSVKQLYPILNYWLPKVKHYDILVWCKTNSPPLNNHTFLSNVEYIIYLSNRGLNNLRVDKHSKFYLSSTNMFDKNKYLHPTIKPLKQIENFIQLSSNENDLILDTFAGSGTTAIACKNTNRRFIGYEKNKKYYDIAVNRINNLETNNNQYHLFE